MNTASDEFIKLSFTLSLSQALVRCPRPQGKNRVDIDEEECDMVQSLGGENVVETKSIALKEWLTCDC